MAETWMLPCLKHILLNVLSSPEIKLAGQQLRISNHLDMIRDSLWAINAVILDACGGALENSMLKMWLQDVSIAIAGIEDILQVLQEKQEEEVTPSPPNLLHHIHSTRIPFVSSRRHAILVDLKQIAETLNCLLSKAVAFGLQIDLIDSMDPNQTEYYSILLREVVGRDDDIKRFLQDTFKLQEGQLSQDVSDDISSAIVITGQHGVGKSMFARMIYHHPLVCEFFQHRIWVDVSNCTSFLFDHKQIAKECAKRLTDKILLDDDIWSVIRSSLPQTRYLLVLDGVDTIGDEDGYKWEELKKNLLSSSSPGSKVIITCKDYLIHRSNYFILNNISKVAMTKLLLRYHKSGIQWDENKMRHITPFHAKLLCSACKHSKVSSIEELVYKYNEYLAMATKFFGTYVELQVFRYIILLRPLPLSFLKQCFYMLIAEGTTTYSRKAQQQSIEKDKFFWFAREKDYYRYFDFHKNVHHIRMRGGQESSIPQQCRYLCMLIESKTRISLRNLQAISPRTLILYRVKDDTNTQLEEHQIESSIEIPKSLIKSLVILSITDIGIQQLPDTICMLLRLRYLNLSEKEIQELPETICNLHNLRVLCLSHCKKLLKLPEQIHNFGKLQVLKLDYCTRLQKLPKSITSLLNLQVLDVEACYWLNELPQDLSPRLMNLNMIGCTLLTQTPIGIYRMTDLQALSCCTTDDYALQKLQSLTNIEQLHLRHLECVRDLNDIGGFNMENKPYLENLLLHWEWWNMATMENDQLNSFEVLDCLKLDLSSLNILQIISCMDRKLPNSMKSRYYISRNLVELRLINLKRCEELPLPLFWLESLELSGMDSLTHVGHENDDSVHKIGRLRHLTLSEMPNFEQWNCFCPFLQDLTLINCPKLKRLPKCGNGRSTLELNIWLQSNIPTAYYTIDRENRFQFERMEIVGCHEMRLLPEAIMSYKQLYSLSVIRCSKLQSLPDWLQKMKELKKISVIGCRRISYIPEKLKLQLKDHIIIQGCPKLQAQTRRGKYFI